MNLLESTDATQWAEEFVRLKNMHEWTLEQIDEGLMVAWFANCLFAQEVESRRRFEKKIDRVRAETLGYAYQWLCLEADKGRDIREIEVPELLEAAERDLEWES